jgi:hypothetical protein
MDLKLKRYWSNFWSEGGYENRELEMFWIDMYLTWRHVMATLLWPAQLLLSYFCFVRLQVLTPWWWRQHVPQKRRSTIILHGSTSQKINLYYYFLGNSIAMPSEIIKKMSQKSLPQRKLKIICLNKPRRIFKDKSTIPQDVHLHLVEAFKSFYKERTRKI